MGESPVKNIFKVFSQEYDKEDADESFVGLDDSLPDLQPYQAESLGGMEIENVTSEEVDNGRSNIRQVETRHKNRQDMREDEGISTSCEIKHNLQEHTVKESIQVKSSQLKKVNFEENQTKKEVNSFNNLNKTNPSEFKMKACFKAVKEQFGRLYHLKYNIE